MSTPETVKAQLQADIAAANAATGKQDTTMHDAVASLIEGFGQGGVGKLICDTVIDVPESDTTLDITIDNVVTENATGDIYVTIFEFLGEIPTDTTVFAAFQNIALNYVSTNTVYGSFQSSVASGVKSGVSAINTYATKNVIYPIDIGYRAISVRVINGSASYDTCRGQWRVRCYKVSSW